MQLNILETRARKMLHLLKYKLFTCKENLNNIIDSFIDNSLVASGGDAQNAVYQITNKFTVFRYLHIKKIVMTVQKTLKEMTSSRIKRMTVLHWKHLRKTQITVQ